MGDLVTILLVVNVLITAAVIVFVRKNGGVTSPANTGDAYKLVQDRLDNFTRTVDENFRGSRTELNDRLDKFAKTIDDAGAQSRRDAVDGRKELLESVNQQLQRVTEQLKELREANDQKLLGIEKKLEAEVNKMRESNEAKLEQMRVTVDEKLHGTLEKRLGESFGEVVKQLAAVQSGLGEMKNLATGVGDLKRVLTNVKNRGSWGEVQLGRQLEDMLSQDQYEANVTVKPGSRESVEYAIRLPGRVEGEVVYLPIDAKFPQEDYERLLNAQDSGDIDRIEAEGKAIERAVKAQAVTIAEKYIAPPNTTDFAIMYLPTEGLYAEVIRRPGLASELQNKHHVLITGPTTLMAILNSLQMGFRTLRIEKSAGDVIRLLGAVKTEFAKYAGIWEKIDKQIGTVQKTVEQVGTRTRAINRSLRTVEAVDPAISGGMLELDNMFNVDEVEQEVDDEQID